jgi:hypothetical protein
VGTASVLATAVFAWWATGVPPFTLGAYVAVGIPVGLVGAMAFGRRPAATGGIAPRGGDGAGLRGAYPWLILAVASVGLECTALALGGRSTTVPTLSTVVDHALGWHGIRFLLFCGWLAIGCIPALRAVLRHRSQGG